ncbi:DNA-binding TFAR19-related protein, partial [Yamadazyma tenuis ATCC 10573]
MDDSELNAIRQARLAELQKNTSQQQPTNPQAEMKVNMLNQALDVNARERLSRVRIVRPDRAEAVENYVVKLISMGSLTKKLTEQEVVGILNSLARDEKKKDAKIIFNRRQLSDEEDDDDFF